MSHNIELIEQLFIKHSYLTAGGVKSKRAKVIEEYQELTGGTLSERQYKRITRDFDREALYQIKIDNLDRYQIVEEKTQSAEVFCHGQRSDVLSPDDIIRLHGRDPELFDLVTDGSTRSKIGTNGNDEGYFINTYSKATFKPKTIKFSRKLLTEVWEAMNIKPFTVEPLNSDGKGLLVISLNDVHIWLNSYATYENHVREIVAFIQSKQWEQILIKQGGDWFHSNNSQGTTVAGTQVAHEVSKTKIFEEGSKIIHPIITEAIKHSKSVKYVYIEGNHDKDMAWSFAWGLERMYPQVEFDIEEEVYKKHVYKNVLLLMTHGDKPKNLNNLGKVLFNLFRKEMALAETIEVHTEHIHHEKVKDDMGMVFRTNPTAAMTDKYHHEGGFIGARKIFQCFGYNEYELKDIKNITGR